MSDDDVKLCGGFAAVVDGLDAMLQHRKSLIQELATMTARAELAERQVGTLIAELSKIKTCRGCNLFAACREDGEKVSSCNERLAAWSRAEAAKGVQG